MVIMNEFYDQNLIMNLLEFETENEDDLKRLKDLLKSKYQVIDFNKLIPVPKEFDISICNSFDLVSFDSLLSDYLTIGLLDVMIENNLDKNPIDVNKALEIYNKTIRGSLYGNKDYVYYRLVYNRRQRFIVNFNKFLINDKPISKLKEEMYQKIYDKEKEIETVLDKKQSDPRELDMFKFKNKDLTTSKGLYYLYLLTKYCVTDSYEFKQLYWGTNYNCIYCRWIDNKKFIFYTFESIPFQIFYKIHELFPNMNISIYTINESDQETPSKFTISKGDTDIKVIKIKDEIKRMILNYIYKTIDPNDNIYIKDLFSRYKKYLKESTENNR